ncbi:hypothetical protein LCGC14_1689850 [marine sediment metagenome]|uniref:Uncharacterized protein n=1 Tax=marine sediment metagenome TaxID=412755 RepID=A0A0F9I8S2_9ZZZZ
MNPEKMRKIAAGMAPDSEMREALLAGAEAIEREFAETLSRHMPEGLPMANCSRCSALEAEKKELERERDRAVALLGEIKPCVEESSAQQQVIALIIALDDYENDDCGDCWGAVNEAREKLRAAIDAARRVRWNCIRCDYSVEVDRDKPAFSVCPKCYARGKP